MCSELNTLGEAAINHDIRTRCECGSRTREKGHRVSNLVIGTHPAHGNACNRCIIEVGHMGFDLLPSTTLEEDGSGANSVDPNA